MTTNKLSEDVGKKIVEALKMQNGEEVVASEDVVEETPSFEYSPNENEYKQVDLGYNSTVNYNYQNQSSYSPNFIDSTFQQCVKQSFAQGSYEPEDMNLPPNVAVLRQLMTKLPTGVTRQTGALIIKQTMEALGISMQSVIQDAKQVKDTMSNNVKEYQNNIFEYRKQIGALEHKIQQSQRQAAIMNDIINLFVQTGVR